MVDPTTSANSTTLAAELAKSYRESVEYYRKDLNLSPKKAVAKADDSGSPAYQERILHCAPDQVAWGDLRILADQDPTLAAQRWEAIQQAARDELQSGFRAAKTMDAANVGPWERAQYLAVRDMLAAEWRPRTGIEWSLIDTMAISYSAFLFWQERLTKYTVLGPRSDNRSVEEDGCWYLARVTEHEAMQQATAMVDRYNRLFLRTLRALRDLRRYNPTIVLNNSQVNVAQRQQVNVAAANGHAAIPVKRD